MKQMLFLTDCLGLTRPDRNYHVRAQDINPATGKAYAIRPDGIWDDTYFAENFGGGASGTFNFDYEGEAQKAYGELGAYYDRILKESQGDLNKAMARLTQDYDTGVRIKREDTATSIADTTRSVRDNALARGLYQKSNVPQMQPGQTPGYGIPDAELKRRVEPIKLSQDRYESEALINKQRQETDLPEAQKRDEYRLEQERREKAASLADTRGSRALQKWSSELSVPSMT